MCPKATALRALAICVAVGTVPAAWPQSPPGQGVRSLEWRRLGSTVIDKGLPSPAGGPVQRVWYANGGSTLFVRTADGRVWATADFERWSFTPQATAPPPDPISLPGLPEGNAKTASSEMQASRLYAVGSHAYRSDDGGRNWANLTQYRQESILGNRLYDVAVSPSDPNEVTVAGEYGVWRSMDGGTTWIGANEGLPNLPLVRLLRTPGRNGDLRAALASGEEVIWPAGERVAWRITDAEILRSEQEAIASASRTSGAQVTTTARSNTHFYAGTATGGLLVSLDNGTNWRVSSAAPAAGRIVEIVTAANDGNFALAITGSAQDGRVLRTQNGGLFWDDLTANLPPGIVRGLAADRVSGAVYVATERGLYMTYTDTVAAAPAASWTLLREGRAVDVMLDSSGNQLYLAMEGAGVYAAMAPHRRRDPRVVSAADRMPRPAAPGALLSVLGARVLAATAGDRRAPVLAATDEESQIQIPFEATGSQVALSMNSNAGRFAVGVPLRDTAPSVFVDGNGNPLIMNGDTGLLLDAGSPARSGMRLQILTTGLGRVKPEWPSGIPAPLEEPPAVIAPVRVYVEREPVEVLSATLAPGYTGMYLIEIRLSPIVNRGSAELYVEASGQISNRVRIWLEP